ncbi:MAG: putative signaling protein [Stenotrophomonas maltophilia]|nr:MAG: putative signaling protein [Stenotrophomonas maltophilia]
MPHTETPRHPPVFDSRPAPRLPSGVRALPTVRRNLLLFCVILAVAFGATAWVVLHIARQQDNTANEQTYFYTEKALQNRIGNSAALMKSYAFWTEAYKRLQEDIDEQWAFEEDNIGPSLYLLNGYEGVCLQLANGKQYVMIEGKRFQSTCDALVDLPLRDIRAEAEQSADRDQVYTRYTTFLEQPAMLTAAMVKPTQEGTPDHVDKGALLIFFDQLTPTKLQKLGRDFGVDGLAIYTNDKLPAGDNSIHLGTTPFRLGWHPVAPGSELLARIGPTVLAVLALLTLFLFWLARTSLRTAYAVDHYQHSLQDANDALEASEGRFKTVAEAASDWIWEVDEHLRLTYLSTRFERMTGFPVDTWLGKRLDELILCDTLHIDHWLATVRASGGPDSLVCTFRDHQERKRICKITATAVQDDTAVCYRGATADVTDEMEANARIQHLSAHDSLTGLPNRSRLAAYLEDLFNRHQPHHPVLLMLDLDRFKPINDSLGHPAGDAVLKVIAERLRQSVRGEDLVARLGGDEFVIVCLHTQGRGEVERLCQQLVQLIAQPIEFEGLQLQVGTSIGIAQSRLQGADPRALLRCADVAMYEAKAAGRNTWRFYSEDMDALLAEKKRTDVELRMALQESQFELFYLPRFDVNQRRIAAVEALIRWRHPRQGLVGPDRFIALAEENELIVPIGNWVLREACRTALQWQNPVRVSVNISPLQFAHGELVEQVRRTLAQTGLPPARLELEITESIMLSDIDGALSTLHGLKSMGVHLNMDDFGTSYSSLGYLRSYPFDSVKIDRRFIASLERDGRDLAVVQAIIRLGKALDLKVTAEGVETEEQLQLLREEDCQELQGYLFSKPLDGEGIARLLAEHNTQADHRPA